MRLRVFIFPLILAVVVLYAPFLEAGWPASGGRRGGGPSYQVVIDKVGYDLTFHVFTSSKQIKEHTAAVTAQNAQRARANKLIMKEVKKLQAELDEKTRQLGATDDAVLKAELEKAIAEVKEQIDEKKSKREPLVKVIAPKRFSKREKADEYIVQVKIAAEKAKARAEARKAKS